MAGQRLPRVHQLRVTDDAALDRPTPHTKAPANKWRMTSYLTVPDGPPSCCHRLHLQSFARRSTKRPLHAAAYGPGRDWFFSAAFPKPLPLRPTPGALCRGYGGFTSASSLFPRDPALSVGRKDVTALILPAFHSFRTPFHPGGGKRGAT